MNYILLDLEWNDTYCKKTHGFVNEIVEFGAVKLDEQFNEIDRFSKIVRSSLTKRLSNRFKQLTGMTNEQMQSGILFCEALDMYKKWAGEDIITLTWSNSDLHTLYHNCMLFTGSSKDAVVGKYVDLQRYFQHELSLLGNEVKNQISLSNAAALFNINFSDESLHHALDDSEIAAAILRKCYNKKRFDDFIVDTAQKGFYEKMMFKAHYLSDLNHPLVDKNKLYISCPSCKNKAKRVASWYYKRPWFHSRFACSSCNIKFKAAISVKRYFDRVDIKKKIFEASAKEIQKISATKTTEKIPVNKTK